MWVGFQLLSSLRLVRELSRHVFDPRQEATYPALLATWSVLQYARWSSSTTLDGPNSCVETFEKVFRDRGPGLLRSHWITRQHTRAVTILLPVISPGNLTFSFVRHQTTPVKRGEKKATQALDPHVDDFPDLSSDSEEPGDTEGTPAATASTPALRAPHCNNPSSTQGPGSPDPDAPTAPKPQDVQAQAGLPSRQLATTDPAVLLDTLTRFLVELDTYGHATILPASAAKADDEGFVTCGDKEVSADTFRTSKGNDRQILLPHIPEGDKLSPEFADIIKQTPQQLPHVSDRYHCVPIPVSILPDFEHSRGDTESLLSVSGATRDTNVRWDSTLDKKSQVSIVPESPSADIHSTPSTLAGASSRRVTRSAGAHKDPYSCTSAKPRRAICGGTSSPRFTSSFATYCDI